MIKRLAREEGSTIFLCTHQLRYAQEICSTYGLIDDGKLLATGDIDTLRGMVSTGLTLRIRASHMPADLSAIRTGGQEYTLRVESEGEIPGIVRRIVNGGGDVYHVSADSMTLEDIYFALAQDRSETEEM